MVWYVDRIPLVNTQSCILLDVFIMCVVCVRSTLAITGHVSLYHGGVPILTVTNLVVITTFVSHSATQRVIVISRLMLLVFRPIWQVRSMSFTLFNFSVAFVSRLWSRFSHCLQHCKGISVCVCLAVCVEWTNCMLSSYNGLLTSRLTKKVSLSWIKTFLLIWVKLVSVNRGC